MSDGLGPTGLTVANKVAMLRARSGISYAELSRRLTRIGRPIAVLGLRRIEAGDRRVDSDDLVALAAAFGVSPITLLMPDVPAGDTEVTATGVGSHPAGELWAWLRADEALRGPLMGSRREAGDFIAWAWPRHRLAEFSRELRLHYDLGEAMTEIKEGDDDGDD
jgi:transcriptional regulator with XRE-family HTH domain